MTKQQRLHFLSIISWERKQHTVPLNTQLFILVSYFRALTSPHEEAQGNPQTVQFNKMHRRAQIKKKNKCMRKLLCSTGASIIKGCSSSCPLSWSRMDQKGDQRDKTWTQYNVGCAIYRFLK